MTVGQIQVENQLVSMTYLDHHHQFEDQVDTLTLGE